MFSSRESGFSGAFARAFLSGSWVVSPKPRALNPSRILSSCWGEDPHGKFLGFRDEDTVDVAGSLADSCSPKAQHMSDFGACNLSRPYDLRLKQRQQSRGGSIESNCRVNPSSRFYHPALSTKIRRNIAKVQGVAQGRRHLRKGSFPE